MLVFRFVEALVQSEADDVDTMPSGTRAVLTRCASIARWRSCNCSGGGRGRLAAPSVPPLPGLCGSVHEKAENRIRRFAVDRLMLLRCQTFPSCGPAYPCLAKHLGRNSPCIWSAVFRQPARTSKSAHFTRRRGRLNTFPSNRMSLAILRKRQDEPIHIGTYATADRWGRVLLAIFSDPSRFESIKPRLGWINSPGFASGQLRLVDSRAPTVATSRSCYFVARMHGRRRRKCRPSQSPKFLS